MMKIVKCNVLVLCKGIYMCKFCNEISNASTGRDSEGEEEDSVAFRESSKRIQKRIRKARLKDLLCVIVNPTRWSARHGTT